MVEIVAEWAGNIDEESISDMDEFMECIHVPKLKLKVILLLFITTGNMFLRIWVIPSEKTLEYSL